MKKRDNLMEGVSKDLDSIIRSARVLALPRSASRILELSKDPENGPSEYEIPIVADPGLTAQILSFANSSFFGFSHRITTIRTALTLISTRTIRNFVLWNAVFSLMPNPKIGVFGLKRFYQDALRRAVFCKVLAGFYHGTDPELLFMSGLFQDIALPVLIRDRPDDYNEIFHRPERLSDLEQKRFGWTHADAGALLVREWGLNEEVARSVAGHLCENDDSMKTPEQLADAIVHLSGLLPSANGGPDWSDADRFFPAFQKLRTAAKSFQKESPVGTLELFGLVDARFVDMLTLARLPNPEFSLCDCQKEYFHS